MNRSLCLSIMAAVFCLLGCDASPLGRSTTTTERVVERFEPVDTFFLLPAAESAEELTHLPDLSLFGLDEDFVSQVIDHATLRWDVGVEELDRNSGTHRQRLEAHLGDDLLSCASNPENWKLTSIKVDPRHNLLTGHVQTWKKWVDANHSNLENVNHSIVYKAVANPICSREGRVQQAPLSLHLSFAGLDLQNPLSLRVGRLLFAIEELQTAGRPSESNVAALQLLDVFASPEYQDLRHEVLSPIRTIKNWRMERGGLRDEAESAMRSLLTQRILSYQFETVDDLSGEADLLGVFVHPLLRDLNSQQSNEVLDLLASKMRPALLFSITVSTEIENGNAVFSQLSALEGLPLEEAQLNYGAERGAQLAHAYSRVRPMKLLTSASDVDNGILTSFSTADWGFYNTFNELNEEEMPSRFPHDAASQLALQFFERNDFYVDFGGRPTNKSASLLSLVEGLRSSDHTHLSSVTCVSCHRLQRLVNAESQPHSFGNNAADTRMLGTNRDNHLVVSPRVLQEGLEHSSFLNEEGLF